jgi:16S rRNA pseudouridine516 synthase
MQSRHTRLDRFLSKTTGRPRGDIRQLLAQKRVRVDGELAIDVQLRIGEFSHVVLDDEVLQANVPRYIMLNKPAGVVSATRDHQHKTVIDCLAEQSAQSTSQAAPQLAGLDFTSLKIASLHIVGRLDFNSTGLLLLTNNGQWSRQISSPVNKVLKRYLVKLDKPATATMVRAFAEGIYFEFEGITTKPALLTIITPRYVEVGITEGKYHQIKRMSV